MGRRLFIGLMAVVCAASGCSGEPGQDDPAQADSTQTPPADADEGTGAMLDTPDPMPETDSCIDDDACPDEPSSGEPATASGYDVGTRLIVLTYSALRKSPSSTSAAVTTIPRGIPRDSLHAWGQPAGYIPPGQIVTVAAPASTNGYWQVTFDGRLGWVLGKKMALANQGENPVDFAMGKTVRNAFYKNQLHRSMWNKDGPSSSGNCAPTSLAMALHVFGEEPAAESIETSIHRVRVSYGVHSDAGPTSRVEIREGARKLGLHAEDLGPRVGPSASLRRIEAQLAHKHAIVLEGQPGQASTTPTIYQAAMNRAYAVAIRNHETLQHSRYTFDGTHSIFVLGRDAAGDFVVGDPISEVGFVTLTARELEDFVARWGGTGTAVWK